MTAALMAVVAASNTASAVTIHQHIVVHRSVGGLDPGAPVRVGQEAVRVVRLKPPDSDQDGCANADDSYWGPGCNPPPPVIIAPASTNTTSAEVTTVAGACPASLAGESTSPTAVNPTSGAAGCIQAIPSTWAAYGDPAYASAADAPVSVQMEAMARICAAQGNDAWTAADPCG